MKVTTNRIKQDCWFFLANNRSA